jgi:hypothetical protein
VRHAPGGSSSINLSFDEKPLPVKSAFKPVFEASEEPVPEPVVEVRALRALLVLPSRVRPE